MSLYANYLTEKTDDQILETEKGFATYRYLEDESAVYIVDIYVLPEFRKSGEAAAMADAIATEAKERGVKRLVGSVVPSNKGSTDSLRVLLAYGFKLDSSSNNFLLFKKEL